MSCGNKIVCPGSDSPFANVSSEAADPFLFLGVYFCGGYDPARYGPYPKVVFGTDGVEDAAQQAASLCPVQPVGFFSPTPVGPAPAYPPTEGLCLVGCPDPTMPSDAINFTNTAQSCTACCQAGPCESFTMNAGKIQGRNQAEADFWAKRFACYAAVQMVLVHCPGATCLVIDGVTVCKPNFPTYDPPPAIAIFWNGPQSCEAQCPDGTVNVYTTAPGRFSGRSQLQADTVAASYACRQASRNRFCVTSLDGHCCLGSSPSFTITAFGGSGSVNWAISSGALPDGLSATVSERVVTISGTTSVAGDFTFGFDVSDSAGHTITKSFTISVLGITNSFSLPSASNAVPYVAALTAAGGTAPYQFALVSGALPTGLTIALSGAITGTPNEPVTANFPFVASVKDATGAVCTKALNIFVQGGCMIADPSPLPACNQGLPYSHQFTVSGGTGPFTWVKTSGAFPTGISLSSGGLLSGTPTSSSDANFTIQVTDSSGPPVICSAPFVLPVIPALPKKYRIKNYVDGVTFSIAACSHLLPPQGEPVWNGTFPFADSGNFLATVTQTNFVYQVLVNGRNITNLALTTANCYGGPEWQLCLVIDSAIGAWGAKKLGSTVLDSPVGIYTRVAGGCASGPATIEIEEYT